MPHLCRSSRSVHSDRDMGGEGSGEGTGEEVVAGGGMGRQGGVGRGGSVRRKESKGIHIAAASKPLSFSVLPFSLADLAAASHPYELPRREFNMVFIDSKLHGVGGDNSWGARTHPEYTLRGNQSHEIHFTILPIE